MKKLIVLAVIVTSMAVLQTAAFAGEGKGCCKMNFGPKNSSGANKACCAGMPAGQHGATCPMNKPAETAPVAASNNPVVAVPTAAVEATQQAVNASGSAVANVVDAVTPDKQ